MRTAPPFLILKLALAGVIRLYVSEPVLAEYRELLTRKSFPLDSRRASLLFKSIRQVSILVKPMPGINDATDPDDNIFLECAVAAKADYLITGNTKHFPAECRYTTVVTPATFLAVWRMEHSPSSSS